jgi:hypothetical protein
MPLVSSGIIMIRSYYIGFDDLWDGPVYDSDFDDGSRAAYWAEDA